MCSSKAVPTSLRQLVLRFAKGRGPFTTAQANERFGRDVAAVLRRARARRAARPRRVAAGRDRARVVRSRRPAAPAPRVARGAAEGGRARRAGGARAIPARLARRRPAGNAARGARAVAGAAAAGRALGVAAPAAPGARLPAGAPRRALRERRGRLARRRPGPRRRCTSAKMRPRSAASPARPSPEGRVHDALRAALRHALHWDELLAECGLDDAEALPALWDLVWAGEATNDAWTPLRAARRNGLPTRRAPAAPVLAPPRRGHVGDAGPLVADRAPLRRSARPARARRAAARAAGHRHARRRAGRGDSRRLRRGLRGAACARDARALPSRLLRRRARRRAVRARRRRRAAARGARARRTATRSCSRPPTRRSRTARRCRGRTGRARGPRASPARSSCSLAGEPLLYVERGGRSLVPLRDPDEDVAAAGARCARRPRPRRAAPSGSRSSASTASPSPRAMCCRCSSRPGSSPARAAPSSVLRRRMPEGDTLHRAAARLQPLVGERIEAESPHPRAQAARVAERIDGRRLESVEAVGKNLVLRFEGGVVLRSHLRMSRPLDACGRSGAARRAAGRGSCSRGDTGRGRALERPRARAAPRALARLGPDILDAPARIDAMLARLRAADRRARSARRCSTRSLVAGIGNMWMAETLWRCGSRRGAARRRAGGRPPLARSRPRPRLMRAAVDAARAAARQVYRRAGRPCPRCGTRDRARAARATRTAPPTGAPAASRDRCQAPWCRAPGRRAAARRVVSARGAASTAPLRIPARVLPGGVRGRARRGAAVRVRGAPDARAGRRSTSTGRSCAGSSTSRRRRCAGCPTRATRSTTCSASRPRRSSRARTPGLGSTPATTRSSARSCCRC